MKKTKNLYSYQLMLHINVNFKGSKKSSPLSEVPKFVFGKLGKF